MYQAMLTIPVIIVTGLATATPEWARLLGAVGLLYKPIDVKHLKSELDGAARRKHPTTGVRDGSSGAGSDGRRVPQPEAGIRNGIRPNRRPS
jgi:hypothetical protein